MPEAVEAVERECLLYLLNHARRAATGADADEAVLLHGRLRAAYAAESNPAAGGAEAVPQPAAAPAANDPSAEDLATAELAAQRAAKPAEAPVPEVPEEGPPLAA